VTYAPAVPRETQTHKYAIAPWSMTTDVGPFVQAAGGGAPVSAAWPLANLALGYSFQVPERCIAYAAFYATGATAGGNLDIGIYDLAGAKIQTTGTQARVASAHTNIDWTDLTLEPGQYYAMMSADTTANYAGWVMTAGMNEALGCVEMATAFVLPATITYARTTRTLLPYFGFALNSSSI